MGQYRIILISVGVFLLSWFIMSFFVSKSRMWENQIEEEFEGKVGSKFTRNIFLAVLFGSAAYYVFRVQLWPPAWIKAWYLFIFWLVLSGLILAKAAAASSGSASIWSTVTRGINSVRDILGSRGVGSYYLHETSVWSGRRSAMVHIPFLLFLLSLAALYANEKYAWKQLDLAWPDQARWSLLVLLAATPVLGLIHILYRTIRERF
jgi:hypothetical protein